MTLDAAVVALGQAATTRLLAREGADHPFDMTGDLAPADAVPRRIGALGDAWDAAEQVNPAGPEAQLARLTDGPEEQILLALAASPDLDEDLGRLHPKPMTAASLLDLATDSDGARQALVQFLAPERALRARHLIECADGPATEGTVLSVPPSVVAAFRGDAPDAPDGADLVEPTDRTLASALVEGLGLWSLQPMLTVLTGPDPAQRAVAEILTSARGAFIWHLRSADHPDWGGLIRDSALAGAVVVVNLQDAAAERVADLQREAIACDHPVVGLHGPARGSDAADGLPRVDLPISLVASRVAGVRHILSASDEVPERLSLAVERILRAM